MDSVDSISFKESATLDGTEDDLLFKEVSDVEEISSDYSRHGFLGLDDKD